MIAAKPSIDPTIKSAGERLERAKHATRMRNSSMEAAKNAAAAEREDDREASREMNSQNGPNESCLTAASQMKETRVRIDWQSSQRTAQP